MYIDDSRGFPFYASWFILMYRVFACTPIVVFILCFLFPHSVVADYYLRFLKSSLRLLQFHKTSEQRITLWRSNTSDKYVTNFIFRHSPDAFQFPTPSIPANWHNWDLVPNAIHLPEPFITPIYQYQPDQRSKCFKNDWWWKSRILAHETRLSSS